VASTGDHTLFPCGSNQEYSGTASVSQGKFGKDTIKSGATVTMSPGDYPLKTDLVIEDNTTIIVSGSVQLFFKNPQTLVKAQ